MIKSLWHTQTTTELRLQNTPDLSATQSKVISKYSMISLGTETLVLNKKVPEIFKALRNTIN